MTSLRVERHPRGHVASCNGQVELLSTRVESCFNHSPGNASQTALLVETLSRKERERKAQQLETFQKRVKHRVTQRERERQREIATVSNELVKCEQKAAEKAVKLDKIKVQRSVEVGHDIEDVKVIASGKASLVPQCPGKPTASQLARINLLRVKKSEVENLDDKLSREHISTSESGKLLNSSKDTRHYQTTRNKIYQSSSVSTSREKLNAVGNCFQDGGINPEAYTQSVVSVAASKAASSTLPKFSAPSQLEHAQKKQAAQQYYLFRKLYSDLERAQARQRQLQLTHNQRVEKMKRRKEADRRVAEDEVNFTDSCSFISTEAAEDQQRAEEWVELMAAESKKQWAQKDQEMDRYIQALRAQLKDQLDSKKLRLPPLCACAVSLWDTSPDTCANNCTFYKNPKAYAKALSNLLHSLQL